MRKHSTDADASAEDLAMGATVRIDLRALPSRSITYFSEHYADKQAQKQRQHAT